MVMPEFFSFGNATIVSAMETCAIVAARMAVSIPMVFLLTANRLGILIICILSFF